MRTASILLALALVAASATAATIVVPTDERLVEKSDAIVTGRIVSVESLEIDGAVWTEARVAVDAALKGETGELLRVREIGGRLGQRRTVVFGAPEFRERERVLLFLTRTAGGGFRSVDLLVGKFTERERSGRKAWVRDASIASASLLGSAASTASRDRLAEPFERWIRDRAAGLAPPAEYFRDAQTSSVTSDFGLISPPEIYRWFAFDEGGTVAWRSSGSQAGFSGGGVNELQTGMAAWTSYSAARIALAYTGPTSTTGGLDSPNAINEVVFDDPDDEIAGSWNGTDGVLAAGGFNAVSGPRAWTAPFAAGPGQEAGAHQVFVILEGNLVVQDGVSPTAGISSTMLAEVIAHEFGHTLGFGHSSDPSALMFASLQSLGAFLREDDRTAARWLYPSGGGETPPPPLPAPAAPSALSVLGVTPESAQIRWTDNAINEKAQTIYVRAGSAAFAKFADVAANVTTANLSLEGGHTYSIRVTARNDAGESPPSNTIEVVVPHPPLEAAFSLAPPTGTAGITTFSFYDQSTGRIASRQWSFGDGAGSPLVNPTHLYQQPGSFTVRLTLRGVDGEQSVAERVVVVAVPPLFVADFSWDPGQVLATEPVHFQDQSAGSPTSWAWNFGDGTSSSERNPTKVFATPGVHRVSLVIANGIQTSRADRDVTVTAGVGGEPAVTAEFDATTFQPRSGQTVHFTDRSAGEPSSWSWDFGDGSKSVARHPSHVFGPPGTYPVTLIAARGSSSSTRVRVVQVREASDAFAAIVPAAAQTPGAGGSEWRTDLAVHNAGAESAEVTLRYLPDPGITPGSQTIEVPAKSTVTWSHALQALFGLDSGRGALAIEATSSAETPQIHVSSRTYTASGDATYGQFVPAVALPEGAKTLWVTGIESNAEFRTNVGWANPSLRPVRVRLQLWDASGADLGTRHLDLAQSSFGQVPLAAIYEFLSTQPKSGLTLRIDPQGDGIVAYASLVDQRTNDPTFLLARELPVGDRVIVPAAAKTPGAAGTFWRTDLALFNPGSTLMRVRVRLLESGLDNRFAPWKDATISPSRALAIRDLFDWLGRGSGTGAVEITWTSATAPVVTSRTYTTRTSDDGTFGQAVPAVSLEPQASIVIAGLRSDARFRANVGLVSYADVPTGASVQALAANGEILAETFVPLPPRTHLQMPLATLFPDLADAESIGEVTLVARPSGDPAILLYGSVVDRASGDPIFID